jgi:hypothetical protein
LAQRASGRRRSAAGLQWRTAGHGVLTRVEGGDFLKPARGGVRRFAVDQSELRLGMGSHGAMMCRSGGPMASGSGIRRRVGTCRVAPTTGLLASRTGEKRARRMDQQMRVGLGVRVRRAGPGENRGGRARRAHRRRAAGVRELHASVKQFQVTLFMSVSSKFFNRSGPRFLYQSCTPHYPLQLCQKP